MHARIQSIKKTRNALTVCIQRENGRDTTDVVDSRIPPWRKNYRCVSWWTVLLSVIHDDFMPPPAPLSAGGIMFSGCPSVRPSKDRNTRFQTVHGSVGPSDQPLPFSVRPSGEVFPDISRRTDETNDLKFCMLIYPHHLKRWSNLFMACWFR